MKDKLIIGRADIVDLPELSLFNLSAKVDTGAYTCAIHCSKIKEVDEGGEKYITFRIPSSGEKGSRSGVYKLNTYKQKNIKSSSGHIEKRYVIKTKIRLFNKTYLTEFSLADRSKMKFPVLLGRKLLRKKFIVDVSKKDLSYKNKLNQQH